MAGGPPPAPGRPAYRDLVESGAVVAGGPDTVAERLEHLARTMRVGNLSVFMQLGSLPHDLTTNAIDLFCERVLPRLRPL